MKKIITLSSFFFYFSLSSFSQIIKGSVLLGGDFLAFTEKQKINSQEYARNGIYFSPLIGKAIKDNLIQGAYMQVGYEKNEYNQNYSLKKSNSYGAGIFLRKYSVIKNDFYGFIQGNLGFLFAKYEYEYSSSVNENKQTSVGINISPGLSYKISKKLHLEAGLRELASLGYSVSKSHESSIAGTSNFETYRFSVSTSLNNFNANL